MLRARRLSAGPDLLRSGPRVALVLQTDFGLADGSVAAMKGVALTIEPRLVIHDLTHQIPPYDIREAALRLRQTIPWWPQGTVFVSVVDPGVGTERRAVVARTRSGHYVVTPDNGTLTWVADVLGIEAIRIIDPARHRLPGSDQSHTFHGRDLFVVVGARLAAGQITLNEVGPPGRPGHRAAQPARGVAHRRRACAPRSSASTSRSATCGPTREHGLLDSARVAAGDSVRVTIRRGTRMLFQGTRPVRGHVRRGGAGPAARLSQQPARPGAGAQPG